jgi:hypothetical protein
MIVKRVVLVLAWAVLPVVPLTQARAEVPVHAPGTICFTPQFWCWAQPPGPPGTACGCPRNGGWVQGVRG